MIRLIYKINQTDIHYPYLLKQIYNNPENLYLAGNPQILNSKCIAIVGTRKATSYGKKMAYSLAYNFAKQGYTIVSGLALGIDSFAHIGALRAGGSTIAVMATSLNRVYPRENAKLATAIIESKKGAIITENNIGEKLGKDIFPKRNRIISGLCEKVIVVEAEEESGALITADLALEQNREVYAVAGNIASRSSIGTNKLLKEGAMPIYYMI